MNQKTRAEADSEGELGMGRMHFGEAWMLSEIPHGVSAC